MREDILIVLNEREKLKETMSSELEEQLSLREFSVSRVKPSDNITQIILERAPRVVILDYLLGDMATALDVLSELEKHREQAPIRAVVWTDELSVSAAVTAMKLGAFDYIELGTGKSLERVVQAVQDCLRTFPEESEISSPRRSKKRVDDSPIIESKNFRESIALADSLVHRQQPIIALVGETGSGRNTVARYIHEQRSSAGELSEIDLDTWTGQISNITGGGSDPRYIPLLSFAATVMIDHAEFDTGELLDSVLRERENIWNSSSEENPVLIVGTSSIDTALSWCKTVDAELLEIPPLRERQDAILPLIQRFIYHTESLTKINKLDLSPELLEGLRNLVWPGNVRQLRAAIIDAVCTPLDGAEQDQIEMIVESKDRWERYHLSERYHPSPLEVRTALETTGWNFRLAAVKLGTGVPQIHAALQSETISPEKFSGAQNGAHSNTPRIERSAE